MQSGKDAKVLINLDNLSGLGGLGHLGGEIQKISLPQGSVVLTAPGAWSDPVDGSTWTFIGNGAGLSAFQVAVDVSGNPTLTTKWSLAGGGAKRRFAITGQCGIPATALAVAANITVVGPAANGDLRLGPSGFAAQTSRSTSAWDRRAPTTP